MNPFVFGKVVSGENFYDRIEETSKLTNILSGKNNVVIFAPRRYGKTSLVSKVMEELEKKGIICIYLDFMLIYSQEIFIETYVKQIIAKQNNFEKAIRGFTKYIKSFKPIITFDDNAQPQVGITFNERKITDNNLEEAIDLPEKFASENKKYVIVMDEFQEITQLNIENFEKLLRSKIQFHNNVNYLFLGSKTHLLQEMFLNKNNPFYNSAFVMQLSKIPALDSINYLKTQFQKFNINISEETAEYLLAIAENIPYYIQLLASEVWQLSVTIKNEIETSDIDIAADKIINIKNDYYLELYENLSKYQKMILKAISTDNREIFSKQYHRKHRLSAVSTTQKSVNALINSGIIFKSDDEYQFSDPFFKKFIVHYTI